MLSISLEPSSATVITCPSNKPLWTAVLKVTFTPKPTYLFGFSEYCHYALLPKNHMIDTAYNKYHNYKLYELHMLRNPSCEFLTGKIYSVKHTTSILLSSQKHQPPSTLERLICRTQKIIHGEWKQPPSQKKGANKQWRCSAHDQAHFSPIKISGTTRRHLK